MRTFWAILVGALIFFVGRFATNMLTAEWFVASWQAAAIPPAPGRYFPTYDEKELLRLLAVKLGLLAIWSFVAATISGSMAPHRAYRCAMALAILFVAEFAGMRWWISYLARPAYVGTRLMDYLTAIPDLITVLLFLFLGAAVARGLRRNKSMPVV
ncbi:MAG: hypothetical protein JNL25_04750 [Rhodospirillaceae bacterium]|nr:hypothetical protein [Rhodospirillaceae bacterium]